MPLRLVVWNCNMALDRKWEHLLSLNPDVAVVPEAATPEILRRKAPAFAFANCEWEGWYKHKGLAVFTFGAYSLRRNPADTRHYSVFLPLEVRGPHQFHLLAVWAFNTASPPRAVPNAASIRGALAHYAPFLNAAPSVVAGDFNSSTVWDRPGGVTNHALTVADLSECGLASAYHHALGCPMGAEPQATLFQHRNLTAGFHIDYCFAPKAWLGTPGGVTVERPEDWVTRSDHVPLVVRLDPDIGRSGASSREDEAEGRIVPAREPAAELKVVRRT
jgi:hypothetical protein